MLSIFTPTHKSTHLLEAYSSIVQQTFKDWEWVIVPNNGIKSIPDRIIRDKRVRVVCGGESLHNVGALKRFACDSCAGNGFVELDHDDLLLPGNTLQKINDAFRAGAGFAYSDTAVFRYRPTDAPEDNKDNPAPVFKHYTYSRQHGWENYPITVYGRYLAVTRNFEVTPRSLSEILYAPDHVRSWSRKAYYEAGGHDRELSVCDDHALMIKTYLSGAKFQHIGGCGYLYRSYDHNTVLVRNKKIQELSREHKMLYLGKLITKWASYDNRKTLNITELLRDGWKFDRDLLLGFGSDAYAHIIADVELQKLPSWQVREFMNNAYAALIPGGYLTITVPEVHSGMGYADVEWQSHFSTTSMSPYTRKDFAIANGKVTCRFQEVDCFELYPSDWHKDRGFKYLRFTLCALKGQRQPGLQHI